MPAAARPTHTHSHAGGQAGAKPKLYNPRHPERTLLYQTIAEQPNTSRPGLSWPVQVSSTARATTTPPSPMSAKPFASIWNAASLPSGCATSCSVTGRCSTWCCASSCALAHFGGGSARHGRTRARRGFLRGLRALPRGDIWPHAVEMPIRYPKMLAKRYRHPPRKGVAYAPGRAEAVSAPQSRLEHST